MYLKINTRPIIALIIFGVILYPLLLGRTVNATSYSSPRIIIKGSSDKNLYVDKKTCLDKKCLFSTGDTIGNNTLINVNNSDSKITNAERINYPLAKAGEIWWSGELIIDFYIYREARPYIANETFFEIVEKVLNTNVDDLRPVFFNEMDNLVLANTKNNPYTILFTQYDTNREKELITEQKKEELQFKRYGNWLMEARPFQEDRSISNAIIFVIIGAVTLCFLIYLVYKLRDKKNLPPNRSVASEFR